MDEILSDYAIGFGADFVKMGIMGKERLIKHKKIIDIERSLKNKNNSSVRKKEVKSGIKSSKKKGKKKSVKKKTQTKESVKKKKGGDGKKKVGKKKS